MRFAAAALLLLSAAGLSACSSYQRAAARQQANPAPCPNVFVLTDASRFVEFAGDEKTLDTVAWTGEIEGVETSCRYFDDVPIRAEVEIDLSIGRGPAAGSDVKEITYFVAVTRTNRDVIAKEVFQVPVTIRDELGTASLRQKIDKIVIPRAGEETSGVNFEIAVGFALDRDQVIYNRSGKSLKFPEL